MRATWLADVLRGEGLRVLELSGWKTRETRAGFDPVGIVAHHTATGPNVPNENVRALLRDGRSDLSGPLSQLGLERDGLFVTIAAGRCNHNGFGQWGNDAFGIEAYNDGQGEPWPKVQVDAYHRGCAAICRKLGWGPSRVMGHKETDPGRKIDPANLSMTEFRAAVSQLLVPRPTPLPMEVPGMAALIVRKLNPAHALFECGGKLFVAHNKAVTTTGDTYAVNEDVWADLTKSLPLVD